MAVEIRKLVALPATARLLESTNPDPIDDIAAIVEREADGVAVSANGVRVCACA